jgi:hypothetical protein
MANGVFIKVSFYGRGQACSTPTAKVYTINGEIAGAGHLNFRILSHIKYMVNAMVPQIVSNMTSINSQLRPGTKDWCHSSNAPDKKTSSDKNNIVPRPILTFL